MKGLALAAIYAASVALMFAGIETGRIPEDWASVLYLIWATAGLMIVAVAMLTKND